MCSLMKVLTTCNTKHASCRLWLPTTWVDYIRQRMCCSLETCVGCAGSGPNITAGALSTVRCALRISAGACAHGTRSGAGCICASQHWPRTRSGDAGERLHSFPSGHCRRPQPVAAAGAAAASTSFKARHDGATVFCDRATLHTLRRFESIQCQLASVRCSHSCTDEHSHPCSAAATISVAAGSVRCCCWCQCPAEAEAVGAAEYRVTVWRVQGLYVRRGAALGPRPDCLPGNHYSLFVLFVCHT